MDHRGIRHWHVYYRRPGDDWRLHSRFTTLTDAADTVECSRPWLPGYEWRIEHWDGKNPVLAEDTRRAAEWRDAAQAQRLPL